MKVVLDTHTVLWYSLNDGRLSARARQTIENSSRMDELLISSITLWEISLLAKKTRIKLPVPYLEYINDVLQSDSYKLVEISPEIAKIGAEFDSTISQDPADRIIAATSVKFQAPLVTADSYLRKSTLVETIW